VLEYQSARRARRRCRAVLQVLDRIGDKWTVMVVGAPSQGPTRFNAIMRSIDGVSHRMLTLTLRSLECDGLVKRTAYATIPPKVEYELTKLGGSLSEPLKTLAAWVQRNRKAIEAARARFEAEKSECRLKVEKRPAADALSRIKRKNGRSWSASFAPKWRARRDSNS
jgi:DNA-binding HxlR family transcriptional regulator